MGAIGEEDLIRRAKEWIRQQNEHACLATVEVTEDIDLLSSGVLDSMGFIELMLFLETVIGEKIDLSDVDPDDFTTIRGLAQKDHCRQDWREYESDR